MELREISPRRPSLRRRRPPILWRMMMREEVRRIILPEVKSMVRRAVREELEKRPYNYINPIPRQLVGGAQHARYHLKFQNKIYHPLHTFRKIQGEAGSDVEIALFDNDKEVIVTSGSLSSIKVEIVVLNGDFNNDDRETWSEEEFNRNIAHPRPNKGQLLNGERFIKLNNGIGSLGNIAFTDNSSHQKTSKFRLGVRYAQSAPNRERIQEGITEPLRVKDRRGELAQKHDTPSLDDEVWRLKYIRNGGKFHKRLQGHDIQTVQDFLRYYNMEKGNLRNILGRRMSETHWKEIVKQARECDPGDSLYSYYMREKNTLVVLFFNSIYHLVGVKFGNCYTTLDNLDTSLQDSVESWKNLAYRNINGMQLDHRMINGHPMPLLVSDVTSLSGSSTLPPHNSNSQIRNSAILADQVDSQVRLLQETSVASEGSLNLIMEHLYIDVDIHQPSYAETSDVSCERDNSLVFTIPMETAPTTDEQGTPVCPQNQVESSPFVESLRAQSNFPQMSSFDPSFFEGPIQTSINNLPASLDGETNHSLSRMSSFDLSFFGGPIQTSINNLPASLGGETNHSLSRMSRLDSITYEEWIPTSISSLPASSGGETSRSVAPPSLPPRWSKLLAPIKWVQFAKKRRARILVHQTLVATV